MPLTQSVAAVEGLRRCGDGVGGKNEVLRHDAAAVGLAEWASLPFCWCWFCRGKVGLMDAGKN